LSNRSVRSYQQYRIRLKLAPEEKVRKEIAHQLIATCKPTTAKEIQNIIRDMFADVLQESLEGELEDELGYSKCFRTCAE